MAINYYFYPYIALTGGTDGALDSLDGALLKDGDAAYVVIPSSRRTYVYTLDADSAATEDGVQIIAPDQNAGDKRWVRTNSPTDTNSVLYYGATGAGVADDHEAMEAADVGVTGFVKYPPGTYLVSADVTLSTPIIMEPGAKFSIPTGVTLTINGAFSAEESQVFSCAGTGAVAFGSGAVREARTAWWGFTTGTSTAIKTANMVAIQAAIDSGAPAITFLPGDYSYGTAATATGITISRSLRVDGAGSVGVTYSGTSAASSTKLSYIGTGVAIALDGVDDNGTFNVHLSNFTLEGTSGAEGGIRFGDTLKLITNSSLKNILIQDFTKSDGYGLKVVRGQQSVFENVNASNNAYGINIIGRNTVLSFINCTALYSTKIGLYIQGTTAITLSFYNFLAEGNLEGGIIIYGSGVASVDFYNLHSEANCTTSGTPIVITGSGGDGKAGANGSINFFGGYYTDYDASNYTFSLGYAEYVYLHGINLPYDDLGIVVTANTSRCKWDSAEQVNLWAQNIVGNHTEGLTINNAHSFTINALAAETNTLLNFTTATLVVTDKTTEKTGIFKIINATSAVLVNDGGHFGVTSGGAEVNIFPATGKFYIRNDTAGPINVVINVLSEGGF